MKLGDTTMDRQCATKKGLLTLAVVLCCTLLPVMVLAAPLGYDVNDWDAAVVFAAQQGITLDPNDPSLWPGDGLGGKMFYWNGFTPKRIAKICLYEDRFSGVLDFRGFSALDGIELEGNPRVTGINLHNVTGLMYADVVDSGCTSLVTPDGYTAQVDSQGPGKATFDFYMGIVQELYLFLNYDHSTARFDHWETITPAGLAITADPGLDDTYVVTANQNIHVKAVFAAKTASALPKTGDGFPVGGLLTLAGILLAGICLLGVRLRNQKAHA